MSERNGLLDRLHLATIGSCTCLTKTPDPQYHDNMCPYRLYRESAEEIEKLSSGRKAAVESSVTEDSKRFLYTLKNSIRIAQPQYRKLQTWAYLSKVMGIGSTAAHETCRKLGLDPDDIAEKSLGLR